MVVSKLVSDHHSHPPASLATLPSTPVLRHDSRRSLFGQSGMILATLRVVELSPDLIEWPFLMTCATLRSSRLVSACQSKADTHRAPPFRLGGTRVCFRTALPKTVQTIPIYRVYDNIAGILRASLETGLFLMARARTQRVVDTNGAPSISILTAFLPPVSYALALLLGPLLP